MGYPGKIWMSKGNIFIYYIGQAAD